MNADGEVFSDPMSRAKQKKLLKKLAKQKWCEEPLRLFAGTKGRFVEYENNTNRRPIRGKATRLPR